MANFLVTGGGGFIGSHVCEEVLRRGDGVRVLDDFSTGRRENLAGLDACDLIEGSIEDLNVVRRAVAGVDYVVHLAALPSVARSVADPVRTDRVNILGTLHVLLASRDAGVKRVVFASSSSVYGETEVLPKVETMVPSPRSPYAISKLTGEHYCSVFTSLYGLQAVALRFFNIFGPRQDPTSQYSGVIALFIEKMSHGGRPVVFGDGEQSRDFTYVDNAVAAVLAACHAVDAAGMVINVGCGERHTVNRLADLIAHITGYSGGIAHEAARAGDVRHSQADITLALRLLGYSPSVGFEEGIRRTYRYGVNQIRS